MKKQLLTFMILCFLSARPYAQDWVWANNAESGSGVAMAVDEQGNTYVAGNYTEPVIIFDNITLANSSAQNSYEVFLAKYNTEGIILWAKSIQGTGSSDEFANAITVDAAGNIYLTGTYTSTTHFDVLTITNNGGYDTFIAKYSTDGDALWVEGIGGEFDDQASSITLDHLSNIIVTGLFKSYMMPVGSTTLQNTSNSTGLYDMFLIKYDMDGNVLWAKDEGSESSDEGNSVSIDEYNNIYVLGIFASETITFGTTTLTNAWMTEGTFQTSDIFLTKYNEDGQVLWAKSVYGTGLDYSRSISVDNSNNIYITGEYTALPGGSIVFDTISLPITDDSFNIFLAKYDSDGNVLWAKTEGGDYDANARSVTTDVLGNVYLTGGFDNATSFGNETLSSNGSNDIYLVKYNTDGDVQWGQNFGGAEYDGGGSVVTDTNNDVYLTGYFRSSCSFDSITLVNVNNSAAVFVAKLSEDVVGIDMLSKDVFTGVVFPNPSTGKIKINFIKNHKGLESAYIIVHNMSGESVYFSELTFQNSCEIDLSHSPNGMYFVMINLGERIHTEKIVIHAN